MSWNYYKKGTHFAIAKSTSVLGKDGGLVINLKATEQLFEPYEIEAEIATSETIKATSLGKSIEIIISEESKPLRKFYGNLGTLEYLGKFEKQNLYKIHLYPEAWKLKFEYKFRIFQDQKKREIVKTILKDGGIKTSSKLTSKGSKLESSTQYNESTLNYAIRLLQESGCIAYCASDKEKGEYCMLEKFSDSGKIEIEMKDNNYGPEKSNSLIEFSQITNSVNHKYSLFDYNYKTPATKTKGEKEGKSWLKTTHEIYPTNNLNSQDAKTHASDLVKIQESIINKFKAKTLAFKAMPGLVLEVKKHKVSEFNKKYFIEKVTHTIKQTEEGCHYENEIEGSEHSSTYSPEITKKKPLIQGSQTAIITGPKDKEISVDENGRVRVNFIWDHDPKNKAAPSAWLRLSQWGFAGNAWGSMCIPRVGQEVIVSFLNGDPDHPIVTGTVFNGQNAFPYKLPDNAHTFAIKTQSTPKDKKSKEAKYNEFKMIDKANSEEVYLRSQKDANFLFIESHTTTLNEGTQTTNIDKGDYSLTLSGKDKPKKGKGNYSLTITKGSRTEELSASKGAVKDTLTIKNGDKILNITKGNEKITLSEGNMEITLSKGDMTIDITGARKLDVSKNNTETIKGNHSLSVTGKTDIKSTGALTIKSDADITIQSTGNLNLKGTKVNIEASGELNMKGMQAALKSSSTANIEGSAQVSIKGAMVEIN